MRLGVAPADLSVNPFLMDQPHDRLAEVLVEPQLIAVEVVDQGQLLGSVIAQVSQRAPHVGEVLLFDIV